MPITASVKMGFEGQIFYGTAGTTGATQITNATDMSATYGAEKGETTVRGDGTVVPIQTEDVSCLSFQAEWSMIKKTTDAALEALEAAAANGTAVALRMKDYSAGKGYDGDVTLTVENGQPLKGQQTRKFTATPTNSYGRQPQIRV